MGPPTTNRPVGLMWYFTLRGSKMSLGMTGLITYSITSRSIFLLVTSGLCWVETTIVSTRTGRPFRYSTVTWDLPSGRIHGRRSEEHTSELQSRLHLVCRLLLEKKNISQPKGD